MRFGESSCLMTPKKVTGFLKTPYLVITWLEMRFGESSCLMTPCYHAYWHLNRKLLIDTFNFFFFFFVIGRLNFCGILPPCHPVCCKNIGRKYSILIEWWSFKVLKWETGLPYQHPGDLDLIFNISLIFQTISNNSLHYSLPFSSSPASKEFIKYTRNRPITIF